MAPTIDIFGLTLSEPMTTVTDYLVTAVAWWLGAKLIARHGFGGGPAQLWGIGFLWVGLGAFLGGTSHGFAVYLGDPAYAAIWKATVYSIGLSASFAVAGSIGSSTVRDSSKRLLHALNVAAFAVYGVWMINHSGFVFVILHYVPAMTAIALLHVYAYLQDRAPHASLIIAGVVATLLGAAIQRSGFSLHRHFNHNDLYHLVQVGSLVLFYLGVVRLTAPEPKARVANPV
ncbi:MAG: hypothetical protein OEM63_11320 [Gammaproteobacteria bacterium]|nr:hypothetical protein [Gammaproteobacteria bacterium]